MLENQEIKVYKFGFVFDNITFCWKSKKLYRMPYVKNKRSYEIRQLKLQKVGNSFGYWICGNFKSLTNLREITKVINYELMVTIDNMLPF